MLYKWWIYLFGKVKWLQVSFAWIFRHSKLTAPSCAWIIFSFSTTSIAKALMTVSHPTTISSCAYTHHIAYSPNETRDQLLLRWLSTCSASPYPAEPLTIQPWTEFSPLLNRRWVTSYQRHMRRQRRILIKSSQSRKVSLAIFIGKCAWSIVVHILNDQEVSLINHALGIVFSISSGKILLSEGFQWGRTALNFQSQALC